MKISLLLRLSLLWAVCPLLAFASAQTPLPSLLLRLAPGQPARVGLGGSFDVQLVVSGGETGFDFNGIEAGVLLNTSGVVFESIRWARPFEFGPDDLSEPSSDHLPVRLETGMISLVNVAPDGLFFEGSVVATLRFTIPQDYRGRPDVSVECRPVALLKGFEEVALGEAPALRLRVSGVGPAASEIVWQGPSGFVGGWQMLGAKVEASTLFNPSTVGEDGWSIVASGDFDQDGQRDFILAYQGRRLGYWQMSGPIRLNSGFITPESEIPAGWRLVGSGDVDADSALDLVFQHQDGHIGVWYMQGFNRREARILDAIVPVDWAVVGVADVDGDGVGDLVLSHPEGYVGIWFLDASGGVRARRLVGGGVPLQRGWAVVALRDLDRDGVPDLVLRHRDGLLGCWTLSGDDLAEVRKTFLVETTESLVGWSVVAP